MYDKHIRFDWDERKNIANMRKHRVSFQEAQSVFYDPLSQVAADPDHSTSEDRLVAIGHSFAQRLLLVIHSYAEGDQLIRIISARKVTRSERQQYEELS